MYFDFLLVAFLALHAYYAVQVQVYATIGRPSVCPSVRLSHPAAAPAGSATLPADYEATYRLVICSRAKNNKNRESAIYSNNCKFCHNID